jgi:hypothetical protein
MALYMDHRRVFTLNDAALITGESRFAPLYRKLNYCVRTGKLLSPRRGIYAKPGFTPEELACKIYRPSYLSLEYVLQKAGVVFQYDTRLTLVASFCRVIEVGGNVFTYRKIKGTILTQNAGIDMQDSTAVATPERAFLDLLYLDKERFFDNLRPLNHARVFALLPLYESAALAARVKRILSHEHK